MPKKLTYKELEKKIENLEHIISASKKTQNKANNVKGGYHQNIFEDSSDAIIIFEYINGKILDVNRTMSEMFGYTKEEALKLNVTSISEGISPYSCKEAKEFAQIAISGKKQIFEWYAQKKNGQLFWVEVSLKPIVLNNKKSIIVVVRDIDQRKLNEGKNKFQKDHFEYIIQATNAGTWEWNVITGETIFNERWAEIIGYTLKELAPVSISTWTKHIHPEDLKRSNAALERHFRGESEFYEFECRMKHKEGHWVWILDKGKVVSRTDDGKPLWMYGTHQNITSRKQKEESLLKEEQKYRAILQTAADGFWLTDLKGQLLEVNEAYSQMSGYTEAELLSMYIHELEGIMRPEDVISKIEEVKQVGYERFETKHKHKNGSLYDVEVVVQYLAIENGWLFIFLRNISERKKMEQSLRESESFRHALLQTIPDLIWLKDANGKYLACNAMFEGFFGAKEEEIIGKTDYDFVDKELADFFRKNDKNAIAAGKPTINEEWVTFANDGHRALLETIKTPMKDAQDNLVGVLGIARDITERKKAEEEQANLRIQLQQAQKMESVGRLAGGVAHDFNNMLGVILGYADLSLGQTDPSMQIHSNLQEILKAAHRSADITRQLLAFARRQTIAPKVIDLNDIVSNMLKMLQRLIGEDIALKWLPAKDLWMIKMDPSQIDQILANLSVNARDAIKGVGKITIETGMVSIDEEYCENRPGFIPGEFVLLTFSDSGCGMDKETIQKIFEPFFTTKSIEKGTGLGLATVYGVVKQNNGFINVYSELDIGTTFRIYFPRSDASKKHSIKKETKAFSLKGNETILLVEDDPMILDMTRGILEKQGYNILTAINPKKAIKLAGEYSGMIDLLITDVIMPEMNGNELAKKLMPIYANLKHLFMSGYTADVIARHGVLEEGINFIQKPFSVQELSIKVRETLNKK